MSSFEPYKLIVAAVSVSAPTFAWVLLGIVLRRANVLRPAAIEAISRLAFRVALPILLMISAAGVDFRTLGNVRYLYVGVISTITTLLLSWWYGNFRGFARGHLGVFVQGAFRSNLAIVGIALCQSAYGAMGLALASLPIAVMTALYNILAVWVLNSTLGGSRSVAGLLMGMVKNPLLIGIAVGVAMSLLELPQPQPLQTVHYVIAEFFLPLTLVCIGGGMNLASMRSAGSVTWEATFWRLCISPAIAVCLGLALGVQGAPLGVLFLLTASPVAAASFVMVVAARGDGTLAANIIVTTTLLSMLTVTLGFTILSLLGLVGI